MALAKTKIEIDSSVRSDGAHVFEAATSKIIMLHLGKGIFVSKYFGKCLGAYVPLVTGLWEEPLSQGAKLTLFADCRLLTAYETSYRLNITRWMLKNRNRSNGYHLLTEQSVVLMGIQLANLVTGGMVEAHSKVYGFDTAIRSLVPGHAGIDKLLGS